MCSYFFPKPPSIFNILLTTKSKSHHHFYLSFKETNMKKKFSFHHKEHLALLLMIMSILSVIMIVSCENFNGPKSGTTGTGSGTGTGGGTTGGGTATCDTANVSYSAVVKPILENNCVSCHSGSAATAGVDLSSVTGITRVVNRSRLFPRVLTGANGSPQMPPGSRLTACEIDRITAWVNQGAKNN